MADLTNLIGVKSKVKYDAKGMPTFYDDPIYKPASPASATQTQPRAGTLQGVSGSLLGIGGNQQNQAMQWMPQSQKSATATATRSIGDMPDISDEDYAYEELDEDKVKSRTQEFSALGRRKARSNFQALLSRIYGANPDDPYAKNLARTASQGFSMDTQRAISAGGSQALSAGIEDQRAKNNRRMQAYQAAVNAALATTTATTTTEYEYAPTPLSAMPTDLTPSMGQQALSQWPQSDNPLSLGQPYTYG